MKTKVDVLCDKSKDKDEFDEIDLNDVRSLFDIIEVSKNNPFAVFQYFEYADDHNDMWLVHHGDFTKFEGELVYPGVGEVKRNYMREAGLKHRRMYITEEEDIERKRIIAERDAKEARFRQWQSLNKEFAK